MICPWSFFFFVFIWGSFQVPILKWLGGRGSARRSTCRGPRGNIKAEGFGGPIVGFPIPRVHHAQAGSPGPPGFCDPNPRGAKGWPVTLFQNLKFLGKEQPGNPLLKKFGPFF